MSFSDAMMEKKIFSVDRFEGDVAVCVSDEDDVVKISKETLSLNVNDVFSAIYTGGELSDIKPMPEERDRRLADMRARLHALAKRTKK